MPNLNGERYLARAISSFIAQRHEPKQLVIVDGRSTDGSHAIIRAAAEAHPEIRWIADVDTGISSAINIGVKAATGDIIGYMGGDDLLDGWLFSRIADYATRVDFDAIYFDSYTWHVGDRRIVRRRCPPIEMNRKNLVEYGTIVGLQNIYFRRHVFDRHTFNVDNRFSMDYEFYLAISAEPYLYLYVNDVASVNIFDGNITGRLGQGAQWQEAVRVAKRYRQPGERLFSERKWATRDLLDRLRSLVGTRPDDRS